VAVLEDKFLERLVCTQDFAHLPDVLGLKVGRESSQLKLVKFWRQRENGQDMLNE